MDVSRSFEISSADRLSGRLISPFAPKRLCNLTRIGEPSIDSSSTYSVQNSTGTKDSISSSRSAMSRSVADWTRPADSPRFPKELDTSLLSGNPTTRSSTRLACWALTRSRFNSCGLANASLTASEVIAWNTTRCVSLTSHPAASMTCQAMASPSRSGSFAKKISPTVFPKLLSDLTIV